MNWEKKSARIIDMETPFQNLGAMKLWRELATLQPKTGDRCRNWKGFESTDNPKEAPDGYHILVLGRGQDLKVGESKPWPPKMDVERSAKLNLWWLPKPPYQTQTTDRRTSSLHWGMLAPTNPVEQRQLILIRISEKLERFGNALAKSGVGCSWQ